MSENGHSEASDVYLITVDSLRADFFGPDLFEQSWDYFADDFVRFTNAHSNGIATPLSFPSILADDIVSGDGTLDQDALRLAELFDGTTLAYPNNLHISPDRGYDRGFSSFDPSYRVDDLVRKTLTQQPFRSQAAQRLRGRLPRVPEPAVPIPYTPASEIVDDLKRLIERHRPELCWGHFMDPHGPYYPSLVFDRAVETGLSVEELMELNDLWSANEPIDERGLGTLIDLYEHKIGYLDRHLSTFFAWLKETGRYDDAMIVFTADHGQFIGENTAFGHDWDSLPEDPVVRVPLSVKFPEAQQGGTELDHLVQHLDIIATIAASRRRETLPLRGTPLTDDGDRVVVTKSNAGVRAITPDGDVMIESGTDPITRGSVPKDVVEIAASTPPARVGIDVGQESMSADEREAVNERLKQLGYH